MSTTMMDRGDSYRVQFLGSSMLSQVSTGLGVLQKPLRSLYFQYQQAMGDKRGPVRLQERELMMTNQGMLMSYRTEGEAPSQQEFYAMPSILFWDAVQFVLVKSPDKRFRAAFEPLDNDQSRNKDNLFSVLDKSHQYLQGRRHPPLFTCVLRRTQGLKALDVHAFVCSSHEEALGLVRALNTVHFNYKSGEQQETGVFGYNPFSKGNIKATAGLQNDLSYIQQAGARTSNTREGLGSGTPRQTSVESGPQAVQGHGHANNARDRQPRAKSPGRRAPRDLARFTSSQPNLSLIGPMTVADTGSSSLQRTTSQTGGGTSSGSRVFLLSQSDFKLDEKKVEEPAEPEPSQTDAAPKRGRDRKHVKSTANSSKVSQPQTYGYLQHINRTLDRPRPQDDGPSSQPDPPVSDSLETSPSERVEFSTGGIFQEDKSSSLGNKKTGGMGQGYSLLSGSQGPPPGYAPHQNERHPYAPSQAPARPVQKLLQQNERSSSPTYQQIIPRHNREQQPPTSVQEPSASEGATQAPKNLTRNPSVAKAYDNISKFVDSHRNNASNKDRHGGPTHPSGYPAPVVPTRSPVLGHSKSFRQPPDGSSPERGPPSTTQGTVMAQVTPQSQRSAAPFAGRQNPGGGQNWDRNSGGSTPNLRTIGDSTYSSQAVTHNKPVAMVPPHKIQGVKVLPTPSALGRREDSVPAMPLAGADMILNKKTERPSSVYADTEAAKAHHPVRRSQTQYSPESKGRPPVDVKSPNSGDVYGLPRTNSQKQKVRPTKSDFQGNNWRSQAPHHSQQESRGEGKANSPDTGKPQSDNLLVNQKKDAEIASALENIRFGQEGTMSAHAPHRTNFEKSLGYFP